MLREMHQGTSMHEIKEERDVDAFCNARRGRSG
jgi:hypothetical protein